MRKCEIAVTTFFILLVLLLNCEGKTEKHQTRETSAKENKQKKPDSFLLITIDTWRSDYIGVSGSGKVETPNLDRLAKEGVYEMRAETPCPLTTPAHATILTGLLPLRHKILDVVGFELPLNIPTLAEKFGKESYKTAAFVSSVTLHKRYGLNRGFDIYDAGSIEGKSHFDSDTPERDGSETTEAFQHFLEKEDYEKPLFVWLHYYDAHFPYREREKYKKNYPNDPYAAQVAFVDSQIGIVLSTLEKDISRKWKILIVGDHGEGLGDHGERRHGLALYTETLNVPLVLWPKPNKEFKHRKPWSLEDIYPTVLEWFGFEADSNVDGESLFEEKKEERYLPSITIVPAIKYGVNPCLGVRRGDFIYIRHGEEELFDLKSDPKEIINLSGRKEYSKILNEMAKECERKLPFSEIAKCLNTVKESKPEEMKQLESLGYVGGGWSSSMTNLQKVSIKEVLKREVAMEDAYNGFKKDGDFGKLKAAYEKTLSLFPQATGYSQRFGMLLMDRGDYLGAEKAFKMAIAANPQNYKMLINLAGVEILLGKIEMGRALYEKALDIEPNDAVAHKNLGTLYAKYLNNPKKAVEHYKKYLENGADADAEIVKNYIVSVEGKN